MSTSLHDCLKQLPEDEWRLKAGFSEDICAANSVIWSAGADRQAAGEGLREWLTTFQPCLFGRIAARRRLISYCIINDVDVGQGDEHVRDLIQQARREWWKGTRSGEKHGFILLLASERVARARPGPELQALAERLCALYLRRDEVRSDEIYHDDVFLDAPNIGHNLLLKWIGGVNVFAASGDRRWWNDHRIPAGLGFSVNSVGHMVRAQSFRSGIAPLLREVGISAPSGSHKIEDLDAAIIMAMKTILKASKDPWDPATGLSEVGDEEKHAAIRGVLPPELSAMSHARYTGYYHTDITIPRSYFRPDVERPSDISPILLDLSYLSESSVDNPAHETMARGILIGGSARGGAYAEDREWKTRARVVAAADYPELFLLDGND